MPTVVAEGAEYFVMPDCGLSLEKLLRGRTAAQTKVSLDAFRDGAIALARLHGKGLSHGRPNLSDICWDNGLITFLDFEYYSPKRNNLRGQARDLFVFFYNAFTVAGKPTRELEVARDCYLAQDPGGVWPAARMFAYRLRWANWITKPIQMRREGKANEFKAIPLVMDWFGV